MGVNPDKNPEDVGGSGGVLWILAVHFDQKKWFFPVINPG
jgi:hypothetical protein